MSTNSARRLRKYLPALWLTTALFLGSCSPTRQVTSSASRTETNNDFRQRIDSAMTADLLHELERLESIRSDIETEIILFDTSRPAEPDSAGLRVPPVQAIVRQRAKQETDRKETGNTEARMTKDTSVETTDQGTETAIGQIETEQKAGWWETVKRYALTAVSIPIAILLIWLLYKLVKLFRNGKQ